LKLLLVDNNDSFTYNVVDLLRRIAGCKYEVVPSGSVQIEQLPDFDKIIISPGPGTSSDFPVLKEIITYCIKSETALLGICLGHQAICEYFGGHLVQMPFPVHGQRRICRKENESLLFSNLPDEFEVGLYHSWKIDETGLPSDLIICGKSNDLVILSVRHKDLPIFGVQFHPESFMTKPGKQIFENYLSI